MIQFEGLLMLWRGLGTALPLAACSLVVSAQPAGEAPQMEIANPNATFPAQQRALPPPEVIERGDGLYQVNCMACHGADLRGGDQGGSNLLRSDIVLQDIEGELIGQIIRAGMNRMPAITTLDAEGIRAVAGFIQSVLARAERQGAPPRVEYELNILVGDARRGERAFDGLCSECHSATRDLASIAAEINDAVNLQNTWVAGRRQGRFGGPGTPRTVTISTAEGVRLSGDLLRYDDFFVSLRTADGQYRSFSRVGDGVEVAITDPLAGHRAFWSTLDDTTMHDVTAYLETLR